MVCFTPGTKYSPPMTGDRLSPPLPPAVRATNLLNTCLVPSIFERSLHSRGVGCIHNCHCLNTATSLIFFTFVPSINTLVLGSLNNNCRLPTSNTSSHLRLPHTQQHHRHTDNNTTKMRSTTFSATAALLSALTLVNAQTFTSCNPTTNCTCRFPLVSRDAPLTRTQQAVPPTQV